MIGSLFFMYNQPIFTQDLDYELLSVGAMGPWLHYYFSFTNYVSSEAKNEYEEPLNAEISSAAKISICHQIVKEHS